MGYRVKPFTMKVRDNSTQEFEDIGLLRSDEVAIEEINDGSSCPLRLNNGVLQYYSNGSWQNVKADSST